MGQQGVLSMDVNKMLENPPRRGTRRRAQSEQSFHLPDNIDVGLDGTDLPTPSDEMGEDSMSMYMDVDKHENKSLGNEGNIKINTSGGSYHSRSLSVDDDAIWGLKDKAGHETTDEIGGIEVFSDQGRPRHRHSISMDGAMTSLRSDQVLSEVPEFKKAMTADKLAELSTIDPKRAKRILANRQSAARSKERKTRYISELECKVQTLQAEATTLQAQLTLYQRDTSGLTSENHELKLRLQSMQKQGQIHDALNEALKEEVQQLKIATGEFSSNSASPFSGELQQMPLDQSIFSFPQQSYRLTAQQLQQLQLSQSTLNNEHLGQLQPCSNFPQHGSARIMQGLGGVQSGYFVKPQGSSIVVSHTSSSSM